MSSEARHHRARIAALKRERSDDDPEMLDARRQFKLARIHDFLASDPPLTLAEAEALAAEVIKSARKRRGRKAA